MKVKSALESHYDTLNETQLISAIKFLSYLGDINLNKSKLTQTLTKRLENKEVEKNELLQIVGVEASI